MINSYQSVILEKLSSMIIQLEIHKSDKVDFKTYVNYIFEVSKIYLNNTNISLLKSFGINEFQVDDKEIINISDVLKTKTLSNKEIVQIINTEHNTLNLFKFKAKDAFNYLISSVNGLIYKIGNNLLPEELPKEIYNIGYLGAYEAANEYDFNLNIKFVTYSYKFIDGVF